MREYTRRYVEESIPRKSYTKKIILRKRKPFEIFWQEILIAAVIVFMLLMIFMNYQSNLEYIRSNITHQDKQIEIDVDIVQTQRLGATSISVSASDNIAAPFC